MGFDRRNKSSVVSRVEYESKSQCLLDRLIYLVAQSVRFAGNLEYRIEFLKSYTTIYYRHVYQDATMPNSNERNQN